MSNPEDFVRCSYCNGTKDNPGMMSDDSYSQFKCPYPFHWIDRDKDESESKDKLD